MRARTDEVQLALDTGCDEIFIICPTSELHRTRRLGLDEEGLLRRIEQVVVTARRGERTTNVVCEDASRTAWPALERALECAANAGADRVFLCDTVGAWTPAGCTETLERSQIALPGMPFGVHCHNDLGMATANTIAAVEAGADWPTTTVNGVGERAGNACTLTVAAATERLLPCVTGLDFRRFAELSAVVERLTGFVVPQHQPLVGWNAFRHESGIHVDGLLKAPDTYQAVDPALVGREHRYVVGKHSGRALLRRYAQQHGWPDDEETLREVLGIIKNRRPDWVRGSFARVRASMDRYNETCLGLGEGQLSALFAEVVPDRLTSQSRSGGGPK